MELVQIVFSNLSAMASSQIQPFADRILVMTGGSRHSTNTTLLGKQCQCPQHFFHRCIQIEKWRPSILTETMSAGLTAKKANLISTVSLFENYVSYTLLPVIRTTFVPAPEF
ncbi:MAG: hypothetical protein O8C64_08960 [Candidatus Methanoperedens sp.]|nr:hypothetical protein [Candidatus Methanoperedens sp.]